MMPSFGKPGTADNFCPFSFSQVSLQICIFFKTQICLKSMIRFSLKSAQCQENLDTRSVQIYVYENEIVDTHLRKYQLTEIVEGFQLRKPEIGHGISRPRSGLF